MFSPLKFKSKKLILPTLVLALVYSCSKPPEFRHHLGERDDAVGTVDPDNPKNPANSGGVGTGDVKGEILPLTLDLRRINPLTFKSLLAKLAFLVDTDLPLVIKDAAFSSLLQNRYNLGDYDYARRSPGHLQWETTQINLWMKSLIPYCTSSKLKTKYATNPAALVKAALGRAQTKEEADLLASKAALAADKDKLFEGACLSYLTSLEFRNQWSVAKPALKDYLNTVASNLVQRPLLATEMESTKPVGEIISSWVNSPRFETSSRMYVEQLLRSNGTADGVDFDLPGNLMSVIIKNKKPFSEIITANACYDSTGKETKCDANAPFNAGVLTTRSFLLSHAGPFNISRSYFLLRTFACQVYPLPATLEPPLAQEEMIEPFSRLDGKGFGGDNGNGTNCYACHSQFGKHAQFFVKFDNKGLYVADADGKQDPASNAGSGYTVKQTYVSHLKGAGPAASEMSAYFGKPAANLAEAAKNIAANDAFLECSIRKVLGYYLRMPDANVASIPLPLIVNIKDEIKALTPNPTFQTIVEKSLTNTHVINSYLQNQEK